MSKDVNPDYVIYQAIKILEQAQNTSIESPYKVKILVNEALKILKDYYRYVERS